MGYKGLLDLAYRSGEVSVIQAHVVCEGDEFEHTLGLEPTLVHKPALKEEWSAISDAMKLRNVKGILRKIEYVYVPLMLSASTTADELSQALTARGIDNPCPKTCAVSMRFDIQDYILCLISLVLAVIAVISLLGGGTL